MPSVSLTYSGAPLDRVADWRIDSARVDTLLKGGKARVVPVWNLKHFFDATPRALTLTFDALPAHLMQPHTPPVFLGMRDDVPWFALGLADSEAPPDLGIDGVFRPINEVVALLPAEEASIVAYARAMVIWHSNHLHCGRCGSPAESMEGGHSRQCVNPKCQHRSFPRTDPAVITLVEDPSGERALLGRQSRWPPGMHSIIAGFVEPGETLEECVIRETYEETGVRVGDVRYQASQPWPFPASIMLGFRARAITTEINLVDNELESCSWFTRAELRTFGEINGPPAERRLPNKFSISRWLINSWLAEG